MRRSFKFLLLILVFAVAPRLCSGQAIVDQLQAKISAHNEEIKKLEGEIKKYQAAVNLTSAEKDSLQRAIKLVETNRQKLAADIKLTENKISATSLKLQQLGSQIGDKEAGIKRNKEAIAEAARLMQRRSADSWLEVMLVTPTLADFWQEQTSLLQYADRVEENREELEELKGALEVDQATVTTEKSKLSNFKEDLADEKYLADKEKANKDKLLKDTSNKESNYKKLLSESVARKQAFEKELFDFESQLKIAIDPSLLPTLGTKPLMWPIADHFITQAFGVTADSKRLYTSGSHNGIDLRASVGTPIRAAASGVVVGIGDTDTVCRRASYGKWILLRHANGLSTLYAHLSLIKVKPGDAVMVGSTIAYSGNTGYATGPHLHFTVYATQGVQISSRQSTVCAGTYTMPIADPKAYLNPMDYL